MQVSIIVPAYNVERYLPDCIESILKQTFNSFELILVDDGSTDKTGELCDFYAKKDNRIIVAHKENGGVSSARNFGLSLSTGQFISFIDADDIVEPVFLEKMVALMTSNNCDIVECNCNKLLENGIITINSNQKIKTKAITPKEWITETNLRGFLSVVLWNKLYKSTLFDGINFPEGKVFEDDATVFKLIYKSKLIIRTYEPLYLYRYRPGSIMSSTFTKSKFEDHCFALEEQCSFFKMNGETDFYCFCLSKLCIFLINKYKWLKKQDSETACEKRKQIKNDFLIIKKSKAVPFKYKVFTFTFILFPFLFR